MSARERKNCLGHYVDVVESERHPVERVDPKRKRDVTALIEDASELGEQEHGCKPLLASGVNRNHMTGAREGGMAEVHTTSAPEDVMCVGH